MTKLLDITENIGLIEDLLEYDFNNEDLLIQAFTRKSYTKENGGENNEVLKFIGDNVLNYFIAKIVCDSFGFVDEESEQQEYIIADYDNEDHLDTLKNDFINNKFLANRIDELGFNAFLRLGKVGIKNHKQDDECVKANLFKAILGAVAIDTDFDNDLLDDCVGNLLNVYYYLVNGFSHRSLDYVTLVQKWDKEENDEVPYYEYEDKGDKYIAQLIVASKEGNISKHGEGVTVAAAKEDCAKQIYRHLVMNHLLTPNIEEYKNFEHENPVSVLNELAEGGYITEPNYFEEELNGEYFCLCMIDSEGLEHYAKANNKIDAKSYAAYCCLKDVLSIINDYGEEE